MKPLVLAAGSAACALGCIVQVPLGLVYLFIDGRVGVPLVACGLVLGGLARALDRAKMRAIYGPETGDMLAEEDPDGVSCAELAARDAAAMKCTSERIPAQ